MAVLEILTLPDERLRQVSATVTHFDDELRAFIADLEETRQAGPAAVGIAAPQVNVFQRIVIVDVSGRKNTPNHGYLVLVNPEITHWDGFEMAREKYGSLPRSPMPRLRMSATSAQSSASPQPTSAPAISQDEKLPHCTCHVRE